MTDYRKEIEKSLASYALSFAPTEKQYGIHMEEATDQLEALISKAREDLIEEIEEEWIKATDDRKFFDFLDSLKGESGDK